jgi:hypothetical protein
MRIASIIQEPWDSPEETITKVVFSQVESQCILTRLLLKHLGRPGVDTDLEILGSGEEWLIAWTEPQLSLEETEALMLQIVQG